MAKYYISITETLRRVVCVEAETSDDTTFIVEQAYYDEEVVLDASDYVETVFEEATEKIKMRIDNGELSEEDIQIVPESE